MAFPFNQPVQMVPVPGQQPTTGNPFIDKLGGGRLGQSGAMMPADVYGPYKPEYEYYYQTYGIKPGAPTPPGEKPTTDVGGQFGKSQSALDQYIAEIEGLKDRTNLPQDLAAQLQAVGPYQAYNFALPEYNAPEPYQQFQYSLPDVAKAESVQPMQDALWNQMATGEQERIGQQFADTREQMRQALVRDPARREQQAALMANLGVEQAKAGQQAQQAIDLQRAQQALGISQQEQTLEAQRQQNLAQMEQARQAAQATQGQYGYEQGVGEARFNTALQQYLQEQQAAEAQKAWQSQYGQAQDVAQTQMAQWQAQNAAELDRLNAMLQGQQAQAQSAAQQATYQTNLTEAERAAQAGKTAEYNQAVQNQAAYNAKYPSQTTSTVQPKAQTQYQLPGSTRGNATTYALPASAKPAGGQNA